MGVFSQSLKKQIPSIDFTFEVPTAGKYELTVEVCTLTIDRELLLRLNRRTMVDVALPYTKGDWSDTNAVVVDLKEGRNSLQFTIKAPNKGVSIKYFKLKPIE